METVRTAEPASDRGDVIFKVIVVLLGALVIEQAIQMFSAVIGSPTHGWQYLIEAPSDEKLPRRLQDLGSAGWEIVTARRVTGDAGPDGRPTPSYELILKRPSWLALPDAPPPR